MRVGYFSTHFPYAETYPQYYCAGQEVAASNLATRMAQRGHKLSVFTTSFNREDSVEEHENMTVFRYATGLRIGQGNMSLKLLNGPLKHDMDIVHAHVGIPPAPIAALRYAKKRRRPLVVTYHGDAQEHWGGIVRRASVSFYNRFLLEKVLSAAEVIISPSVHFINNSRFLGRYAGKTTVIPNAINLQDFSVSYSKAQCRHRLGLPIAANVVLFVGALAPDKGPDVLLKAIPGILEAVPETRIVYLGAGPMKRELAELTRNLAVQGNTNFVGFVEDMFKKSLYYRSADVSVLPSTSESFGIVNLEAMACETPIVASRIGGIPDVVKDGENGLLVPPKDPKALADAIVYLLRNRDVRDRMARDGRSKVTNYSWEKVAGDTENIYLSILNPEADAATLGETLTGDWEDQSRP